MMREWNGKRYWLVGASEGLGRALAVRMSRTGVELVLSARSEDRLRELADELPGRCDVVPCDVQDVRSVEKAVEMAGDVDGIVHLAAVYWPMKATEWDPEKAETMADVNLTGCMRLLGRVVPAMVAKGNGHIVLTGSLSGYRGLPGNIGYGTTKAALMNLAQSMRADLAATGVEVQLVNPGFIRTRLTEKNDFTMPSIMEPETAAQVVFDHMNGDTLTRAFPFWFSLVFRLGRFLPDAIWYRIFR
jgi:short-subunit dehydrogenase